MISERNTFWKIFFDQWFIQRVLKRMWEIFKDNSLVFEVFFERMIYRLWIILCAHSGKCFFFGFGNSKTVKGVFDLFRNVFPTGACTTFRWLGKIINFIEMKLFKWRSPRWKWLTFKDFQSLQTEFKHPLRFVVVLWNSTEGDFVYSTRRSDIVGNIVLKIPRVTEWWWRNIWHNWGVIYNEATLCKNGVEVMSIYEFVVIPLTILVIVLVGVIFINRKQIWRQARLFKLISLIF